MKRKTLTITICILSCLALIGVGFAAWVITPTTEETVTGNITVDTVNDMSLTVETAWENGVDSFVFGEKGKTSTGWLTVDNDAKEAVFVLTLLVTVKNKETANVKADVVATISFKEGLEEKFGNLIKTPTAVVNETDEVGVYKVVLTTGWGEFWNEGPLKHYENLKYEDYVNEAQANLNKLNELNVSEAFTLNLTVKPIVNAE